MKFYPWFKGWVRGNVTGAGGIFSALHDPGKGEKKKERKREKKRKGKKDKRKNNNVNILQDSTHCQPRNGTTSRGGPTPGPPGFFTPPTNYPGTAPTLGQSNDDNQKVQKLTGAFKC